MQQPGGAAGDDHETLQSLARGLAVLKAFGAGRERLTMAETAQITGLTRAAARRILLTLQSLGYVLQDDRHFSLSPRVMELGYAYLASRPLWHAARPLLQRLADELNETVSAGVLDGTDVVYVLRIPSSRVLHLGITTGTRLPAHVSSMGRVLLANLPPHQLDDYLRHATLRRYTRYTITEPAVLRARLEEVLRQGWAYVKGEIEEGVSGVSVPLAAFEGSTGQAALNVSTRAERASLQEVRKVIVPSLQRTAQQVCASLAGASL